MITSRRAHETQAEPDARIVDKKTQKRAFFGRDGLAAYTVDPASFPSSRVLYYNDKFVVINDLFPKATVHLLILPRDPSKNSLRAQEAFEDAEFLADCRAEEKKVRAIVASELQRTLGAHSASDQERREAMLDLDVDDPSSKLPDGRDWDREILSGTHANPSMNHLHIHVLSRDLRSGCLKDRNHYQSFTTNFLIRMEEFPLAEDDRRRLYGHFPADMLCWRCGYNFGNKMAALKRHLEDEFAEWRAE